MLQQFVEIETGDERGGSLAASVPYRFVDRLRSIDVEPAGGLKREHQSRGELERARRHESLLVAAGKASHRLM